ncbi:MAG: mechanosensitive ion channel protein [SAR86 cluster bacterium]|uniref:Small-conductance mechanosensitive channel n=1 Tax=SAR86 cluster bacterium TaxID=2030880 RepID=A0A2A5B0Q3_9GAMM|nr:MAG: mechanosensitive ion channel protein [SAR86 cluster bacterium]
MFAQLQSFIAPLLTVFGDNRFIQAGLAIALSFLAAWIFNRVIITGLKNLARRTRLDLDDHVIDLLHTPIYNSILLLGFASALLILSPPDFYLEIGFSSIQSFALIMWVTFFLRSNRILLTRISKNENRLKVVHQQTLPLFLNLINIIIVVLAVYFLFSAWHIDMTAWLASAGIVGIAVGFAAKDTLANLFSGVFIMADAPYKIGDFIVLDTGERGEVTHIGIRSTRILTRADVEVTIPNSVMGNTKIINESGGPSERFRCTASVGVAYGTDIDRVREILLGIAEDEELICQDPEPRVRFRMFGASSLDFDLLVWVHKPVLRGSVVDKLNCAIYRKFNEQGIEIPYSKQDLYIKEFPNMK